MYIVHHFILLGSIPLTLVLIERDGDLSTLCHSCGFDYQLRFQIVSWPYLCQFRGWGSLTMTFTGKFTLGFLSITFSIHRTAEEGGRYLFNSSLPLSRSRTQTGNLLYTYVILIYIYIAYMYIYVYCIYIYIYIYINLKAKNSFKNIYSVKYFAFFTEASSV